MFDRIKNAFSGRKKPTFEDSGQAAASQVSEWAGTQGWAFSGPNPTRRFALEGRVRGRTWRLERGKPSRNFIRGEELRARAVLGIDEDAAVLVMNRPLKEALDKQAYQLYTDNLRTTVDPNLPEELRWLATYEEFGWPELPAAFWQRYSVLADTRDNAQAWINARLADLMMQWPQPGPHPQVPLMMMLLRGKAYLRMEYSPADLPTLQHASDVFTCACESAIESLAVGR
ncbi:MAG: hypothetical protein Q8N17_00925 [Burkholderiaceae bacterium]|nr:hypothetical protein [Burkholderiaceae bacterium]